METSIVPEVVRSLALGSRMSSALSFAPSFAAISPAAARPPPARFQNDGRSGSGGGQTGGSVTGRGGVDIDLPPLSQHSCDFHDLHANCDISCRLTLAYDVRSSVPSPVRRGAEPREERTPRGVRNAARAISAASRLAKLAKGPRKTGPARVPSVNATVARTR